MATRSTIALEYANGQIDQVYCHWDGYLDHNGRILLEHYMDPFKVQKMMDLGSLSTLCKEVTPAPYTEHSFDKPSEDVCVFYGRDRGEQDVGSNRFADYHDYKKYGQFEGYDYILRTDGKWYVSEHGSDYRLLTEAIEAEDTIGYKSY
jgi:hypothetical protein